MRFISLPLLVFSLFISQCACTGTTIYGPALIPHIERRGVSHIAASTNVSLHYASKSTISNASIKVDHVMRYPTIVLEEIASIVSVQCSETSVAITFNDYSAFAASQDRWDADGTFVMVTNHLGDCDAELERGVFLVSSLNWDRKTLVCTASSERSDIASTAGEI